MLGGVGVHHPQALLDVVDEHGAGLPAPQRRPDALGVLGGGHHLLQRGIHRVGQLGAGGDEHARGEHVVLGLADEVRGHVHGVGGVVGEHGDLGGPGLGVDADHPAQDPLGRGDVDVAGTGDQVDRLEDRARGVGAAQREQRDPLRPTGGPHLLDAEQRARSQDRGVRPPAVVGLRGGADHERAHLGGLRGHHVHHHAGGVDRVAAGDVEPHPLHRYPALGDRATVDDLGDGLAAPLVGVHRPAAADRLLQRGPHVGVEALERGGDDAGGHPDAGRTDPVEALAELQHGPDPPRADVVDDGAHRVQHRVHVDLAARQGAPQLGGGRGLTAQVGTGEHGAQSRSRPRSSTATEWVRAPTATKSTPVRA